MSASRKAPGAGKAAAAPAKKAMRAGTADARAEKTRAAIRDAANELFLARGVDATTVDEICERAGVAKGTFYLYFRCKEDLLLEYGLQRLRRVRDRVPELLAAGTFREAMEALVDEIVRGKGWGREVAGRAIVEVSNNPERLTFLAPHRLILPLIEVAQARGEVRRDVPVDVLAQFVMRSVLGALRDWGLGNDATDREAALAYALTLVFDALASR